MGYNISWLAFRGYERNSLLRQLGLVATGETSDYPQGMESGSSLPDEAYLLFLNHPRHRFTEPGTLATLSQSCEEVFGCRVEEFNMSSEAFCWKNGECAWSVAHAAVRDVRNLKITGNPPIELEVIKSEANKLQDTERKPFFFGFIGAQIDHFFRVPIDLAAKVAAYEHDRIKQPWGKAKYELLQPGSLQ